MRNNVFYMLDLLSVGGLTVNEQILKKGFGYTINKALLYVNGSKFQVIVKEYNKGYGLILDVLENKTNNKEEERLRLEEIIEEYAKPKNSLIRELRKERQEVLLKTKVLNILTICVGAKATYNLLNIIRMRDTFSLYTISPIAVLFICTICFFAINFIKNSQLRGR